MIIGDYDPSIYNKELYPDVQYFSLSEINNMNIFINKFNSFNENRSKCVLIETLLLGVNGEIIDIENMKYLNNINKLTNILLKKYYDMSVKRPKIKINK